MWPFTKAKTNYAKFNFKLNDLTVEEKIDLLYDHILLSRHDYNLSENASLSLKINPDSINILKTRSYYSKLILIQEYKATIK